jgi:ribosome-binding ATPase
VKGASQGEGLGNKFLSHIREVDIICHVIRAFEDPDIVHVAGKPVVSDDKQTIETELMLADLQTLGKQAEPKGTADKHALERWAVIKKAIEGLDKMVAVREWITDPYQRQMLADLQLLTLKPMMFVLNVSEKDIHSVDSEERAVILDDISESFQERDTVVWISAKIESELSALPDAEQAEYLRELGLESSGLDRLIRKAYGELGLISFLTCGEKEVRAWTIGKGMVAQKSAGVIHTDFEKRFIKADVVSFADFVANGGWKKSRELGKVRQEGRDYVMADGDVVEFKIGT